MVEYKNEHRHAARFATLTSGCNSNALLRQQQPCRGALNERPQRLHRSVRRSLPFYHRHQAK